MTTTVLREIIQLPDDFCFTGTAFLPKEGIVEFFGESTRFPKVHEGSPAPWVTAQDWGGR